MVEEKYRTIWRRVGAFLIDGLLFLPLLAFSFWLRYFSDTGLLATILDEIIAWAFIIYMVLMHGFKGQTLGKMATRVKVYGLSGQPLSMVQATLRSIVGILLRLVYLILFVVTFVGRSDYLTAGAPGSAPIADWVSVVRSFGSTWYFLDVVVALVSRKRRAVHDFIAGSVVVREDIETADQTVPADAEE